MWKSALGVSAAAALMVSGAGSYSAQVSSRVDFARDVQPIFRQQCYSCHGPTQQKNGFRLDRRTDAMRGGTIAVIGPGNSAGSRLYHRLTGEHFGPQMPPTGVLPPEQIATIKAWIDQGAEWPDALSGETPPPPPDPGASRLMDAVRVGDRARVTQLLRTLPSTVRESGPGGVTPLMYSVLYGDSSEVQRMLELGADPNVADHGAATALMWAVTDIEKTRLLVERGADVNARSADGRTPLLIASGLPGAAPVVKLLLDRGAKIAVRGPSLFGDTTPLLQAAYNGDASIFQLLIERGADPAAEGPPALGFALRAQCMSCAETLLKQFDPVRLTQTMLGSGPPRGPALGMPLFAGRGVDMNAKDPEGRTALMLAAASDALPVDVVKMLIASGADVNATNDAGETALGFARLRGETPIVTLLEQAGARAPAPMPAHPTTFAPARTARAALSQALPLLQRSDRTFLAKSGCVSCHHNTLTAMVVDVARTRGIAVDETIARQQVTAIGTYLGTWKDRALQGIGIPGDADTVSYILVGLAAERYPADASTDAMARFLLGQQAPDGHWRLLAHRPPIESSEIQATTLAMHALQRYAPVVDRARYEQAVQRAGAWIAAATPRVNEDRPFHLLGLHWSGAARPAIRTAAHALLAEQRTDGGFGQLPSLPSDAYATGQALVALAQSRAVPLTDPAFRRGVQFLLKTQLADGSWFVKSRALPIQPHFESGFPHGRDQFISAAATNWAALALALSSPTSKVRPGARP